jgi:hypothetical protein
LYCTVLYCIVLYCIVLYHEASEKELFPPNKVLSIRFKQVLDSIKRRQKRQKHQKAEQMLKMSTGKSGRNEDGRPKKRKRASKLSEEEQEKRVKLMMAEAAQKKMEKRQLWTKKDKHQCIRALQAFGFITDWSYVRLAFPLLKDKKDETLSAFSTLVQLCLQAPESSAVPAGFVTRDQYIASGVVDQTGKPEDLKSEIELLTPGVFARLRQRSDMAMAVSKVRICDNFCCGRGRSI